MNAFLPPNYGGAELAAMEYARRVRDRGGSAVLIGRASGEPPEGSGLEEWIFPAVVPEDGRPIGLSRIVPSPLRATLRLGRPLWRKMWALRDEFDVVHVFNSHPLFNLLAAPIGRALGKAVVLEMSLMGSDDPLTLGRSRDAGEDSGGLLPTRRSMLFGLGHAHVAKSPALAEAHAEAGITQEKLWEIPYGVDVERYRPATDLERRRAREELSLPVEGAVALFVGGMNERKGVHWLVDAFGRVCEDLPDLHLALVGPTEKYDPAFVKRLRRALSNERLSGRVTFVDRMVDNVHEYMRAADIYVLPSTREGLPITVLEAMASGLAVVASDIPEISRTQISPGENGLLVPVGEVDELSEALHSVGSDPSLRRRLASAARGRAEERFSTRVVDERYLELYESLGAA